MITLKLLTLVLAAHAGDSFNEKCPELATCIKSVAKLTGDSYSYDGDLKAKIATTENAELNVQNADLMFTHMLDLNGLTRVPLSQPRSYVILRQRDARDTLLPKATASAKFEPQLPNTWDWYDLTYDVAHPEVLLEMSRLVRNFMPPNTRVVPNEVSDKLLLTGPVPVLKRAYALIKDMDRPLSAAKKKELEEKRKQHGPGPGMGPGPGHPPQNPPGSGGRAERPEPVRE